MRLEFPQDKEAFSQILMDCGLSERRAQVYARYSLGFSNKEIASEFDISKGAVGNAYAAALSSLSDAEQLVQYCRKPEYLSYLPYDIGRQLEDTIEHTVAFSLSRPRVVEPDEGGPEEKWSLYTAPTVEAYAVSEDAYLIALYTGQQRERPEYLSVEAAELVRLIHDWIVPNRLPILHQGVQGSQYADHWVLTDVFKPDWLESRLEEAGIVRVQALTDERFVDLITEDGVSVSEGALTGRTFGGYSVGYRPTVEEMIDLVSDGTIGVEAASDLLCLPVSTVEQKVRERSDT